MTNVPDYCLAGKKSQPVFCGQIDVSDPLVAVLVATPVEAVHEAPL